MEADGAAVLVETGLSVAQAWLIAIIAVIVVIVAVGVGISRHAASSFPNIVDGCKSTMDSGVTMEDYGASISDGGTTLKISGGNLET